MKPAPPVTSKRMPPRLSAPSAPSRTPAFAMYGACAWCECAPMDSVEETRSGPSRRMLAGVVLAVVGVVVGIGAIAVASVPDGTGRIHGCYATRGGALRVIDTAKGQHCKTGERAVTWNQR